MPLGQIVALVMVNKCVKFHWGSLNNKEVMVKVKVFHDDADDNNNDDNNGNDNDNADDDTRVMAITRLFFFENRRAKNYSQACF